MSQYSHHIRRLSHVLTYFSSSKLNFGTKTNASHIHNPQRLFNKQVLYNSAYLDMCLVVTFVPFFLQVFTACIDRETLITSPETNITEINLG